MLFLLCSVIHFPACELLLCFPRSAIIGDEALLKLPTSLV